MSDKSFRHVPEPQGLEALELLQPPHDIHPFGEVALWVTLAYDQAGNLIGRAETMPARSGAGLHTDYLLVCAAPTALEGHNQLWL